MTNYGNSISFSFFFFVFFVFLFFVFALVAHRWPTKEESLQCGSALLHNACLFDAFIPFPSSSLSLSTPGDGEKERLWVSNVRQGKYQTLETQIFVGSAKAKWSQAELASRQSSYQSLPSKSSRSSPTGKAKIKGKKKM